MHFYYRTNLVRAQTESLVYVGKYSQSRKQLSPILLSEETYRARP